MHLSSEEVPRIALRLKMCTHAMLFSTSLNAVLILVQLSHMSSTLDHELLNDDVLSPLTPEQLCQRRGATFARLRMGAQLYSLRASATRLTGEHWVAPYASSLLPRSRVRAYVFFPL